MRSWKRLTALAGALALLLTGCGAEPIPDEVWLGLMEQEIVRRDGIAPSGFVMEIDSRPVEQTTLPATELPPEIDEPETETPETEAPAVTEAPASTEKPVSSSSYVTCVDDMYAIMCSELEQFHTKIYMKGNGVGDMMQPAYDRVFRERPDLFWFKTYTGEYTPNTCTMNIVNVDGVSDAQVPEMYNQLMAAAREIASGASAYSTDYEKVLYVHDTIINRCRYDYAGLHSDDYGVWQTAYGSLVLGSAVCEGYSDGFMLVMQLLDIPCGEVSGVTTDGESHAWNWVRVNGANYWIDVTWDDPSSEEPYEDALKHDYFLINDEMLARTRTIDDDGNLIPNCDSLTDNYFVRNGCYLDSYCFDDFNSRMTQAQPAGSMEVMFASADGLKECMTDLFDNGHIWDSDVYVAGGGSYTYYNNDDMYTLTLLFR